MLEDKKTKKIAILGGPGTGKTTLCKQLDVDYSLAGYVSSICEEFAREYIAGYGVPKNIFEQFLIYEEQKKREENLRHCDIIFCDNATILCYVYGILTCNFSDIKEKYALLKLFEWVLKDMHEYKIFYIPREFDLKEDGLRYQKKDMALEVDKKIKDFLDVMNIAYVEVRGDLPVRVNLVKSHIDLPLERKGADFIQGGSQSL